MMERCKYCGATFRHKTKFCTRCGKQLIDDSVFDYRPVKNIAVTTSVYCVLLILLRAVYSNYVSRIVAMYVGPSGAFAAYYCRPLESVLFVAILVIGLLWLCYQFSLTRKQEHQKKARFIRRGILLIVISSVVLLVLFLILVHEYCALMNVDEHDYQFTVEHVHFYGLTLPFYAVLHICGFSAVANGHHWPAIIAQIICFVLRMALGYVFVAFCASGLIGFDIGSICAAIVPAIVLLVFMLQSAPREKNTL